MFQKGRHSGSPAYLRRDKAFRAQLARAYGAEKVPASFRQALEKTYQSLPDALPAPHRPVRRVIRQAAAACAVLALAFGGLLGLNRAYPQLTEALPGLGPVFQAVNGEKAPAPSPSPSPRPEFQPVVLPGRDYEGSLTVTNAWTDGRTIFLDLEMDLSDDAWKNMQSLEAAFEFAGESDKAEFGYQILAGFVMTDGSGAGDGTVSQWVEDNASLWVNGLDLRERFSLEFAPYEGERTIKAQAVADLTDVEVGQTLEIDLAVPDYCVCSRWDPSMVVDCYSPGFAGNFTLEADKGRNLTVQASAQQNGVTLSALSFTPSRVTVDVELPFTGQLEDVIGEAAPFMGLESQFFGQQAPLGLFPELAEGSGQAGYRLENIDMLDASAPLEPGALLRARLYFASSSNPQKARGPFRLTFYELPPEDLSGGEIDSLTPRRVLAEFTFDPSTGRVYPSENFREEGREQVDITQTPSSLLEGGFQNGVLVSHVGTVYATQDSPSGYAQNFSLLTQSRFGALTFYGYRDGQAVQAFTATFSGGDAESDRTLEGACYESLWVSESGKEYTTLELVLYLPAWMVEKYGEEPFERVELADGVTGEVLIPDLNEALAQNYRLGTPKAETGEESSIAEGEN